MALKALLNLVYRARIMRLSYKIEFLSKVANQECALIEQAKREAMVRVRKAETLKVVYLRKQRGLVEKLR